MTAEPHPQRCETCRYHDATRFDGRIYFGECTKSGKSPLPLISREIYTFQGGLCCHSTAKSEQEIREKVLREVLNSFDKDSDAYKFIQAKFFLKDTTKRICPHPRTAPACKQCPCAKPHTMTEDCFHSCFFGEMCIPVELRKQGEHGGDVR